ncbi:MAG: glutamine synthetase III [Clostridia bacterium]|nr:glutamine synthetase III [Clostridia bacterium]
MANVPEIFGERVFNDETMKKYLPKGTYKELKKTIEDGKALDINIANVVAHAMKEWAIENGATHFTHWFQPMTGITAEKHDGFISPTAGGKVIMEFSGKELIKGEPDASSFPSGGIRATFEARGYTAWDPTSYAFIKDGSLCIPTAFCSYTGEALDKKTPLLRSMECVNTHALRILRIFGDTETTHVATTVGPEQEYFLVDKNVFEKRKDLIYCGRTLFGARPPKGQELEDHYFGSIKPRVSAFMKDLDEELWKYGILAKTKHNEVAPAQHELAPIFDTTNIATDQNQLTMEVMKKVAARHGLVCLLHEKPFAGVNGSGKHNNWSMSTNTGKNLLDPSKNPRENTLFLVFLAAVIRAVDEHQDLLRISVASAGNDHRLGANEAPPAIISMYLGDDLTEVLRAVLSGKEYVSEGKPVMETTAEVLPNFTKDTSDRNRTSPFAFTGNKFEFRMLGSAENIACANFIINTMVADVLEDFADQLEKADDLKSAAEALVKKTVEEHKRIIFNGNNYSEEWVEEAKKRGLLNLRSLPDALPLYTSEKNIKLFTKHHVLTEVELRSRCEVLLEKYSKIINIEALTALDMAKKDIVPAVTAYIKELAETANLVKTVDPELVPAAETELLKKLTSLLNCFVKKIDALDKAVVGAKEVEGAAENAKYFQESVLAAMQELRAVADEMESNMSAKAWPYPSYGTLLFSV